MSTPSSRLVLVTTARILPSRSADSVARRRLRVERRVVGGNGLFARGSTRACLPQVVRQLFREGTRIGENDRRPVLADRPLQPAQEPTVAQSTMGASPALIRLWTVISVGGVASGGGASITRQRRVGPTKNSASRVARPARRRQTDTKRVAPGISREPLE